MELIVSGLDHVNITSPEELIDEVIDWYEHTLGLERLEKPEGTHEGGAWFRVGDQEVHVSVDPHNPPRQAHFGLVIEGFDGVVQHLRERNCHIEQAGSIPGRHRFYTRDPAGNRIELTSYDEPETQVRYVEEAETD